MNRGAWRAKSMGHRDSDMTKHLSMQVNLQTTARLLSTIALSTFSQVFLALKQEVRRSSSKLPEEYV